MPITPDDLCIPTRAAAPFSRPGWIFELKYDGYRMFARHAGDVVELLSRRGTNFTAQFPELAAELAALPDVVLDAELVMLDRDGKPRFGRLMRRSRLKRAISIEHAARTDPAVLFAFDILELDGDDVRARPLLERKQLLVDVLHACKRIRAVDYVLSMGVELFAAAELSDLEGIVAKRADSPYRRGRSNDWVKIKTKAVRAIDAERAKWNER